jgi:predicted enzyme related to lactoylglutathione lyase
MRPNILIYIDFASDDPDACGKFYEAVLGWRNDPQPLGIYHRILPGGFFPNADGTPSEAKNLHMGIYDVRNARPHPEPAGVEPRTLDHHSRRARIWVEISPDDTADRILQEAEARGATTLWRNHFWGTFKGFNHAFRDPWGNEVVLWIEGGDDAVVPAHYTKE